MAYVFKAILAELCEYVKKAENREPRAPEHYLLHLLRVHDAKDEDELVEHKIPEFVFHMLQKQQQHTQNTHHSNGHFPREARLDGSRLIVPNLIRSTSILYDIWTKQSHLWFELITVQLKLTSVPETFNCSN